MKFSELQKNAIYLDVTDKKVPLQFTGKVEKNVNVGFNSFVNIVYFKPLKTNENKGFFDNLPAEITKNFDAENDNNRSDILTL
jgi:hypothetical protein